MKFDWNVQIPSIIDNKQNSNELMPQAQLLSTNVIEGADNDKPHPNETTLQSPEKVILHVHTIYWELDS